jgi:8-amino-7-oxononanoate synthase
MNSKSLSSNSSSDPLSYLERELQNLEQGGHRRTIRTLHSKEGAYVHCETAEGQVQKVLNLTSNDYLGLSQHPSVKQAGIDALEQWGTGSGGSRLLGGGLSFYKDFEKTLAERAQTESALLFSNGFAANTGVLSNLCKAFDHVFTDRLNHASLIDGVLQSKQSFTRYPHLDMEYLDRLLSKHPHPENTLVVTESLFSMDGDWLPLDAFWDLQKKYGFWSYVDQAHSFGGYLEYEQQLLRGGVPDKKIWMGAFGKALGGSGAFVAGSQQVTDYLLHKARSFVYSTALTPAAIAGVAKALEISTQNSDTHQSLQENIQYVLELAHSEEWDLPSSVQVGPCASHIIPIQIGESDKALALSQKMLQQGILLQAIRPPTVPKGTARLRLSLNVHLEKQHIQNLFKVLSESLHSKELSDS